MNGIRLGRSIVRTLLKDRMRYPGRLIVDTCSLITRCGVLLLLYRYVFALQGGTIHGTTYAVAAWSMFLYFAFSTFRLRDITRLMMQDVQSGNVEVLLNKPISYLSYRLWWQIGSGLYSFLFSLFVGSFVLMFLVGIPAAMKIGVFIPTVIGVFIGATALSLAIYTMIGLLAFWIEDVLPVFWMVDKAVMILGGSYFPVALFPSFMTKLSIFSPFGASQFMTRAVLDSWQTQWPMLLGIQAFWVMLLGTGMILLFQRARRNISLNGG